MILARTFHISRFYLHSAGYAHCLMDRVLSNNSTILNRRSSLTTPDSTKLSTTPQANKENKLESPAVSNKPPQNIAGPHHCVVTARNASTSGPPNGMGGGDLSDSDKAKRAAAFACGEDHLRSGQRIGVGSGTTASFLVEYIKEKYESGELKNIRCVPTSFQTRQWLLEAGLPVSTPEELPNLDVAIDGADEIDQSFACIKGGGGCLTQEKIIQSCAPKFILIAGKDKLSTYLGQNFKYLPVEVVPVAYVPVKQWIEKQHGGRCELRMSKKKCGAEITDNNNYILDWYFPESSIETDWCSINTSIQCRPGVVETGLFIDVVNYTYLGSADGDVVKRKAK